MSSWYVSKQGQQSGPMDEAQLRQMVQTGQLGADAYVAGPGLSEWTAASQVPLLAPLMGAAAPAAPATAATPGAVAGMQGGAAAPQAWAPGGGAPGMGSPGYGAPGMGSPGYGAPVGSPGYGAPGMGSPGYGAPVGSPGYGATGVGAPGYGAPGMGAPGYGAAGMGGPPAGAHTGPKGDWVKERLKGLAAVALALLVLVANVASIWFTSTFYPKSVILGLGALFYGGWVVIFGDEYDDETMELVKWKQIGMYAAGGGGALIGLLISILIAD